jgi:hypothetical protein
MLANSDAKKARVPFARYTFTLVFALIGSFLWLFNENVADDYFRIFALAMGSVIVIFATRIIFVNYRMAKGSGPTSLLPNHIFTIAASYIVFVLSGHIRLVYGFGESFSWNGLPFVLVGDILGIAALGVIWRFQEVKLQKAKNNGQSAQ